MNITIKAGQTVYLKPLETGNAYRRDKSIKEAVILKIGRKYVTLGDYGQFHLNSQIEKTDYSPNYKYFTSKDEIELELDKKDLSDRIKNAIPKYKQLDLCIEKLRKIAKILNC